MDVRMGSARFRRFTGSLEIAVSMEERGKGVD